MVAGLQGEVSGRCCCFAIICVEMKIRWIVWAFAVAAGVATIMWHVNDSRQFDFCRAFGVRLGMPVDDFNVRYAADFSEGNCPCGKLNIPPCSGFTLTGIRVGPLEHVIEGFGVMRQFPTNDYQGALAVYKKMCMSAEKRGWRLADAPKIPCQPKEFRIACWCRSDESLGELSATTTLSETLGSYYVGYRESLGHEPAYKAFREDVELAIKDTRFDPFTPLGVSLTNTYVALHFTEQEIADCAGDWMYRRQKTRDGLPLIKHPVDRGYFITDLLMDKQSEWIASANISRDFGTYERQARVEYSTLRDQIAHSISNVVFGCSYTSPYGTVYSDFLAMYFDDRLVRYFPRLMHFTNGTSSVWRVDLDVDTFLRKR